MIYFYRSFVCFLLFFLLQINAYEDKNKELKDLNPPTPKKITKIFRAHGTERKDNYFWMRDDSRKKKEVIDHLKEENNYLEKWFNLKKDCPKCRTNYSNII